jgi:CHAT domain-containing protein/tetratricopeptide (TPR) repeat protein
MNRIKQLLLIWIALQYSFALRAQTDSWTAVNERFKKEFATGKYQEAQRSCDTALQLAVRLHGKNHENYGKSLQNMGVLYFTLGDYPRAGNYFNEALIIRESVHGINSTEAISTLNNLAVLYKAQAFNLKAEQTLAESRKRIEKGPGTASDVYVRNLTISASLAKQQSQYTKARAFLLEALENTRLRKGRLSSAYADILNDLAINAENLGQLRESATYYTEALGIVDSLEGQNNTTYARLLGNIGSINKQLGQTKEAENALQRSIKLYKDFSADTNAAAAALNNLGTLYLDLSRPHEALNCFQRAAGMYRNTRTAASTEYGMSLNNIGLAYKALGSYAEALQYYQRALETRESALGNGHPDVAATLNNMANLYEDMNNHTLSLQYHLAAAEIRKTALGTTHPDYAASLYNRGRIHAQLKDYQQAITLYRQALDIQLKVYGLNGLPVANTKEAMAGVLVDQSQYLEAEQLYFSVASVYRRSLGKFSEAHAMAMYNLSSLYTSWNKYDKAILYFDSSFHLLDSLPHARKLQMQCRAAHCGLLLRADRSGELLTAALSFQSWLEADCRSMFSSLSEAEQNQYAFIVFHHFDLLRSIYLKLLPGKPELAKKLLQIELFTKGLTLHQGIDMRNLILNSGNAEALALFDSMRQLNQQLADAYSSKKLHAFEIQELERRQKVAEQALQKRSTAYRNGAESMRSDWKLLRDQLNEGESWIEFSRFRLHGKNDWTDTMRYIALIVHKHSVYPSVVPLFEEKQLTRLMQQAQTDGVLYRGGKTVSTQSGAGNYRAALYRLIWKPLEPAMGNTQKVYFSVSGQMNRLSFAAIPVDSNRLLSDVHELVQIKSGASLLKNPTDPAKPKGNILLLGGLDYNSKGSGKGQWQYLPGTLAETNAIQEIARSNKFNVNILNKGAASETKLLSLCRQQAPEVLHISTHGYFKGPLQVIGALEDYLTLRGSAMNQAGLILSGGNAGWENPAITESDNGILTALEAGNLNLHGTRLVALSACETGLGEITESEGVFGLQRAFWLAGSSYILMSLWKVPDMETAVFMEAFYAQYCLNRDPQAAYFHAQRLLKTRYQSDPARWAAFVLVH